MATAKKAYIINGFLVVAAFFTLTTAFAIDDGLDGAAKLEGKYFNLYYPPQVAIEGLLRQLNISPGYRFLSGEPLNKGASLEAGLLDMLDTLYLQVCNILDMHPYNFKCNIKVLRDTEELKRLYSNFFFQIGQASKTDSFYVHNLNTIYTSQDNFILRILGHEIAHAVISHYFVVLPSVKVQEVLAMYIEYQLTQPVNQ